jgi:hypothetical protein
VYTYRLHCLSVCIYVPHPRCILPPGMSDMPVVPLVVSVGSSSSNPLMFAYEDGPATRGRKRVLLRRLVKEHKAGEGERDV